MEQIRKTFTTEISEYTVSISYIFEGGMALIPVFTRANDSYSYENVKVPETLVIKLFKDYIPQRLPYAELWIAVIQQPQDVDKNLKFYMRKNFIELINDELFEKNYISIEDLKMQIGVFLMAMSGIVQSFGWGKFSFNQVGNMFYELIDYSAKIIPNEKLVGKVNK